MKLHTRFEWDPAKAARNLGNHGVSFDEAAGVLADPFYEQFHVEQFDEAHSDDHEDRWITTGSYPHDRNIVLVVIWTERFDTRGSITRIISAHPASKTERAEYENEIPTP